MVEEIIFKSIKSMLGLNLEDTSFDTDILIFMNSALGDILDIGIGLNGFRVTITGDETWAAFLGPARSVRLEFDRIKSYVYMYTKMRFDPPQPTTMSHWGDWMVETLTRLEYITEYADTKPGGENWDV
jgi:hypothetical protein